jgi:hypothetical protein
MRVLYYAPAVRGCSLFVSVCVVRCGSQSTMLGPWLLVASSLRCCMWAGPKHSGLDSKLNSVATSRPLLNSFAVHQPYLDALHCVSLSLLVWTLPRCVQHGLCSSTETLRPPPLLCLQIIPHSSAVQRFRVPCACSTTHFADRLRTLQHMQLHTMNVPQF